MPDFRSEDTLVVIAMSPKTTKFDLLHKDLAAFFRLKQEADNTDRFNFVAFQKTGPIYLEDFTFNVDLILDHLEQARKKLGDVNLAGGFFLALTFVLDVFKKVGGKTFRIIVLNDDSAPQVKNVEVIYDLIKKVSKLPTFIDVVRVGVKDPTDDWRLRELARDCGGFFAKIESQKDLKKVLTALAQKKPLKSATFGADDVYKVNADTREETLFYENMAEFFQPAETANEHPCAICAMYEDPVLETSNTRVTCPKCGITAHLSCLAHWADKSNIGMPNVFRCFQCFNLVKLDKEFVSGVQSGKIAPPPVQIEMPDKEAISVRLQAIEKEETPKVIEVIDPLAGMDAGTGDHDD
ncbi:MAG TPA: hypothetical protein VKK79_15405 [Candidatus Lokiarchaeia archaeon]|nr:hypothetical protein [Candidatus Lokiarchaeia archaeon]